MNRLGADGRGHRRLARLFLTLALLWPALPAPADDTSESSRTPTRPLFYRVTGDDGESLWLLGSIHLADSSIYPLPDTIEEAWSESVVLAVEADTVRMDASALQQRMMQAALDPRRSLSERLPEDLHAELAARLESFGMDIRMVEPMRPWFVAMLITNLAIQRVGLEPRYGIEHHFLTRAGERKIVEIEGVDRQLQVFQDMSDELEVLFLRHALVDTKELEESIRKMLEAWRVGDEAALTELRASLRREHPELAPVDELLFTKRNREMTEKIAGYLRSDRRHFVIVGAAHLVGEDSIIALLRRRGLTVERR